MWDWKFKEHLQINNLTLCMQREQVKWYYNDAQNNFILGALQWQNVTPLINTKITRQIFYTPKIIKKKLASKNPNDSTPMFIARDQSRIASHLTDRVVPRLYWPSASRVCLKAGLHTLQSLLSDQLWTESLVERLSCTLGWRTLLWV